MTKPASEYPDAFAMNARLGRGINLGNALEAPREGEWGVTLQADYFRLIREQGFDSVRIPIRWSAYAAHEPPYTINPKFFARVDWAVEQARSNDLAVIINVHHYEEIIPDPAGQRERYLAIWAQIAEHYRAMPKEVLFELLNEPYGDAMSEPVWEDLAGAALAKVRETNPTRYVVIGAVNWNSVDALPNLHLPDDDPYLIGTFHYYLPFNFTHQGAEWVEGSGAWLGATWQGTETEKAAVLADLDKAARWSKRYNRPVLMGEFGAYSKAEMSSRARWTAFVARAAEERGFSWAYWEFCAGFGIYDPSRKVFLDPLVEALIE
jgi:endoglucanase